MTAPTALQRRRFFPVRFWLLTASALSALPAAAEIRVGQNLLQNGSAATAMGAEWTVIANGGNGWGRSGSGGYDSTGGYFITSYGLCSRSQTIDLLAAGATAAELDAAPPIRVSEAISSTLNNVTPDSYYMRVELRDAAGVALATWNAGTSAARKTASTSWVVESNEFKNYGPGVRSIYFEDGGIDGGYWAGLYGTYHDDARVEFLNQPVTDITATPAAFPANVPPGGIAAQLTAADADNAVHTFTLEAEATTATVPLLASRAAGWKYYDSATDPAADWMSPGFDDSTWSSGAAPLGYDSGNADTWKQTQVSYGGTATAKPFTTWYRKTFDLADPASLTALNATLMVDDGCVVYLNGQELFRDGIAEGITVTSTTPANRTVGEPDESDYDPVIIPAAKLALLTPGTNTIAIEVHQDKITSSDISIDLTLSGVTNTATNSYSNDLFEISGSTLRLKNGSAGLATGPYVVRVRATDPAGNTFVKLLALQRSDAVFSNMPSPPVLSTTSLAENTPPGTVIGTFSVVDADAGDAHAYTLIPGAGGEHNSYFTTLGNKLVVAQTPDFEATGTLNILVQVEDTAGFITTASIPINITDDTAEDSDGDHLTEAQEDLNNNGVLDEGETDPAVADTDGDTFNDRVEREDGSDPRDPTSLPTSVRIRQITTQTTGQSWLDAAFWEDSTTLQSFHITITDNLTLRPPAELDPVFPGKAAILQNNAVFRLKHTGTMTIPRIVLDGSTLQHGMVGQTLTVGGAGSRIEIPTTATIDCATDPLVLTAGLSGAGSVRVIGTTTGSLELQAAAQTFTGNVTLEVPQTILAHPEALGSAATVTLNSGTLSMNSDVSLPATQLVRTGGVLRLSHRLAVAGFTAGMASLPEGLYTVAQLITAGVPAEALEDAGGTLVVGTPANGDSDGDGWSDTDEALAGTDPADPNSVLRLSSAAPAAAAGTYTLQWSAVAGITYTVQYSPDLSSPWQDLGTVTATGTDGTYDAAIPSPAGTRGYFRLAIK